jgi:hypothetical protein
MHEGILDKNENGRYVIVSEEFGKTGLASGDICDVHIGGVWIRVRVEHNDNGYYMTTDKESFRPFMGMKARFL